MILGTVLVASLPTAAAPEALPVTPSIAALVRSTVAPAAPLLLQDEEPAAAEEPEWTGSVNLGTSISTGNTEQETFNFAWDAKLERDGDRWTAGLFFNYASQTDGDTGESTLTERKHGGNVQYDYFLTEKSYLLGTGSYEVDKLAMLQLRTTVGAGYGRQFHNEEDFKLSGEAGLSYFNEDFEGVGADGYLAARLASDLDWQFKEDWNLKNSVEVFPSLEDSDDVYAKVDTRVRANLSENMFSQLQWVLDWDNTPAAGSESTDNRLILTLGWSY